MPFAVEDFHDLVRLLEERPEWRVDLRRLVLTTELLAMPEQLAALRTETERAFQRMAEAQARTDERLDALARRMEELAAAQVRTEEQLASLSTRVSTLTEAQARTERQISTLTGQIAKLTQALGILTDDVGDLKDRNLEADYRTKGHACFSRLIRRPHVLSSDELVEIVEGARDKGVLSANEVQEIYDADVIVRGKRPTDGAEVYLVVEVSWGVGPHDVERAVERAALFARTGAITMPVVAGKKIPAPAVRMAQAKQVWQVTNGQVKPPEPTTASS